MMKRITDKLVVAFFYVCAGVLPAALLWLVTSLTHSKSFFGDCACHEFGETMVMETYQFAGDTAVDLELNQH